VTVIASVGHLADEVVRWGRPRTSGRELSAAAGDGAYRFVVEACRLGREGRVQGIVTAPLNKAAMHLGGHHWPGHTEILAHEFGVTNYSMILASEHLNLFHLTTHQSLKSAVDSCTPERTTAVINLAHALARALGQPDAPIGLCGINPHATAAASSVTRTRQLTGRRVGSRAASACCVIAGCRGKWNFVIACYRPGHAQSGVRRQQSHASCRIKSVSESRHGVRHRRPGIASRRRSWSP
jgi:4-hydroxythreonine-4-phosphate dehydrogenase